ncbi:MAG: hypothetical protein K0Q66_1843 [Chitinophagaceae bacterium]|jgi:uncharacterized membrane protein YphA (DoxX/SURF4 family)|nr:hypothetical protein [Chitinophagaceae bacterium]
MTKKPLHQILTFLIAAVWLVNGLICKVLNLVPRHQEIVARIMGGEYARTLTIMIGVSEIAMAVWIISGRFARLNAITQMVVIAVMNTLEFILVPDLLLWGRFNAVFAFLLITLIYFNEFRLRTQSTQQV